MPGAMAADNGWLLLLMKEERVAWRLCNGRCGGS